MHNVWNDWTQIIRDLDDLEWLLFDRGGLENVERVIRIQESMYYIQRDCKGKPITRDAFK